jgi:hypothetical protein
MEEATRRKTLSDADVAYVTAGVLLPEEVALSRFRPEGYNDEIQLDDAARKSREALLKDDLQKLEAGDVTPPNPKTSPSKDTAPGGASSEVPADPARG